MSSNINELASKYIEVISKGDYFLGKKETNKFNKQSTVLTNQVFKLNSEDRKKFLDITLVHSSLSVQLCSSIIAIETQYRSEEAKNIILGIREIKAIESKSPATLLASAIFTEHLFDDIYPIVSKLFKMTLGIMMGSIKANKVNNAKKQKFLKIIDEQDIEIIDKYIEFLNNRKSNGCFMYYGIILSFKYNLHTKEAKDNLEMVCFGNAGWGGIRDIFKELL